MDATPLFGSRTGIGTFVAGALDGLARCEDIDLAVFGLMGRERLDVPGVANGRRIPAAIALPAWGAGLHWPTAEWLAGRCDVVHGTNFVVPPSRRAARVVTVHDLASVRFPELCTPVSLRYPALVRRAVKTGAWVHTPSAFVADETCTLLGVPRERVRAVAHGVEVSAGDGDPALGRRLAGATRYVLALGTVEPRKGFPSLVRAFDLLRAHHADVRLVIAGPDGWGAGELSAAIAGARWRQDIVRVGYVDGVARLGLLAGAAVLAFPSVYEGFGLPPVEAMAAGAPVVATAAGAVPEVVGQAALLVPVGDDEALAEALSSVLDDAGLASALRHAGRSRVRSFTWDRCVAGLRALYGAACESR